MLGNECSIHRAFRAGECEFPSWQVDEIPINQVCNSLSLTSLNNLSKRLIEYHMIWYHIIPCNTTIWYSISPPHSVHWETVGYLKNGSFKGATVFFIHHGIFEYRIFKQTSTCLGKLFQKLTTKNMGCPLVIYHGYGKWNHHGESPLV